jgi:hypothetical protein
MVGGWVKISWMKKWLVLKIRVQEWWAKIHCQASDKNGFME